MKQCPGGCWQTASCSSLQLSAGQLLLNQLSLILLFTGCNPLLTATTDVLVTSSCQLLNQLTNACHLSALYHSPICSHQQSARPSLRNYQLYTVLHHCATSTTPPCNHRVSSITSCSYTVLHGSTAV